MDTLICIFGDEVQLHNALIHQLPGLLQQRAPWLRSEFAPVQTKEAVSLCGCQIRQHSRRGTKQAASKIYPSQNLRFIRYSREIL